MLATPTGDIDRDFAAIMIPQHQAGIDMARAELKYGHNEEMRRLAQRIVSQQEQEISDIDRAVGETSPAATTVALSCADSRSTFRPPIVNRSSAE